LLWVLMLEALLQDEIGLIPHAENLRAARVKWLPVHVAPKCRHDGTSFLPLMLLEQQSNTF